MEAVDAVVGDEAERGVAGDGVVPLRGELLARAVVGDEAQHVDESGVALSGPRRPAGVDERLGAVARQRHRPLPLLCAVRAGERCGDNPGAGSSSGAERMGELVGEDRVVQLAQRHGRRVQRPDGVPCSA